MSPAATKVFPSSIFTSYNNHKQQQHYHHHHQTSMSNSKSSFNNTPTTMPTAAESAGEGDNNKVTLTVWKKSLLMNCNGFTVYDGKGNLVYRVDNYVAGGNRGEIVLMDATGKPLLTIRRKRLSFGDSWMIYDGDKIENPPKLCVRKDVHLLNSKTLAHVTAGTATTSSSSSSPRKNGVYEIEGSYAQRSVSVYDNSRRCVAEIRRKEAPGGISLGVDVFSLIVSGSCIDPTTAMGLVILLEQMFGSSSSSYSSHTRRRYSP